MTNRWCDGGEYAVFMENEKKNEPSEKKYLMARRYDKWRRLFLPLFMIYFLIL